MADHSTMRLGKLAPVHDRRTLKLKSFLNHAALPPRPASCDWLTPGGRMQMYANDRYGDCGFAALAHQIKGWTYCSGADDIEPTEKQVVDEYFQFTGGVDSGVILLDMMNAFRQRGFFGQKIDGFVSVDLKDTELVRNAIYWFGSVTIGVALPLAAQELDVWDVPQQPRPQPLWPRWRRRLEQLAGRVLLGRSDPWTPNSWGGHCVPLMRYTTSAFFAPTWGANKQINDPFLVRYGDEGYVPLYRGWVDRVKQLAPNGIKFEALAEQIQRLAA